MILILVANRADVLRAREGEDDRPTDIHAFHCLRRHDNLHPVSDPWLLLQRQEIVFQEVIHAEKKEDKHYIKHNHTSGFASDSIAIRILGITKKCVGAWAETS